MTTETRTVPPRLTGKEFEGIIVDRMKKDRAALRWHVGRYGVQAVRMKEGPVLIQSLPDFEGVVYPVGTQVIFDAKVCSQASFNLAKYRDETRGARARQLRHMLDRAAFGAICGFVIHWNERQLSRRLDEAATYWFPVAPNSFWGDFLSGDVRAIRRSDCVEHGSRIEWVALGMERTARPDIYSAVMRLIASPRHENQRATRVRRGPR